MSFTAITILGGRGMLGSDLAAVAAGRGLSVRVYDLPEFDVTDEAQVEEVVSQSEVVINCAAYTNVEKAESHVELANQVNGYAVGRLGLIASGLNVPVVHISTDFVFDGATHAPYRETDATNPLSVYGGSKLLGETLLVESGCDHCIVRIQWTYGRHGTHFISKITEAAKTRDVLTVVDDQVGSPTHTAEIAKVVIDLLEMGSFPAGIYHCAASGYASRYEMTRYLFEQLGIATKVQPCKTSDFKTAARRPLNSRFDCTKLQTLLGRAMLSWQDMLKNYLETL
ncbi:MAG: dTDP-4-dehydrorhamnose reductase [Phycisphaerae bacterium]|nr:dTDP-4-dehydrorhamnose reductase [Phycisphaerae bacterium]